ncbi:PREDICTED: soluble scavenger receptor cysteine-rich domain-containing protein SSC5D-like, partial [Corvus brachyrhynchos]|uniref:soluble scavenger receptor cysteine-rich domain-containing protein SSC5D-like n=1 Tax=Corvus brachyrhynchos TaxID=85066 RepID=UPI0008163B48
VAKASPYAPFGQGTGRIWLQPYCRGTEEALEEGPHLGWGQHFCGHESDVGVTCRDAVELRLAGGGSPCAGRVEVKLRGRWGSVADDPWDMEDAAGGWQHLGCGSAASAYFAPEIFGAGNGSVSLARVDCKGNESTLWDCEIRGWGPFNFIHNYDTAVTCQGFSRLVGGDGACAGRLEVRQGRAWVGVCEDQVDMKVAQVVCRELGWSGALSIPGSERFGAGSGGAALGRGLPVQWHRAPPQRLCPASAPQPGLQHRPCQRHLLPLHGLPAGQQQLGMHRAGGGGSEGDVGLRVRQRVGAGRCARPVPPPGLRPRLHRAPGRLLWQRGRGPAGPAPAWLAWVGCEDGARSLWGCPSAPWNLQSCGPGGDAHVACDGDSDGIAETDTTPHPDGATSTGVRGSTAAAVTAGTVPVPTVLCVVLGTLLCVALGALAVLLCRARAWRRGPGRAADAVSNAVYEELDYTAMPEYQEVPSRPGSLSEGSVKKLPYYTGDSVEGSDTEASPAPPARPEHGTPDGYDDALGVPQEPPAPSTGDISEGVAQRRWICVLPTGKRAHSCPVPSAEALHGRLWLWGWAGIRLQIHGCCSQTPGGAFQGGHRAV